MKSFEIRASHVQNIVKVVIPLDLSNSFYPGDDLGSIYTPLFTNFKVWAPTASKVSLLIYDDVRAVKYSEHDMKLNDDGTWSYKVFGDLKKALYMYRVCVNGMMNEVVDPYAKAVTVNGTRGAVVNMDLTNPEGWNQDRHSPVLESPLDAVIYEAHIRDISVDAGSGIRNKGLFLGLTEPGTLGSDGVKTGIDHLVELGVTHVHFLPLQDFATVDESVTAEDKARFGDGISGTSDWGRIYNWGYDPLNFNAPEGSYSSNPYDPYVRIYELKKMIQSLHRAGLKVIMDVVYNHTYKSWDSNFNLLVPGYYHRTDKWGNYTNGSGCGNELATERHMVRKFVVDSLKYWALEYHIDGFRFDLMALIGKDTMRQISRELKAIYPGMIIYGEPWTGGLSGLDGAQLLYKGAQRDMGVAVFNDNFREAIKGDNDGKSHGFALGGWDKEFNIKKGVVGGVYYDEYIQDFASNPDETINYVTSHDNLTLWDKLEISCPHYSEEDKIKIAMLAQAIVLTSQGIPFIFGGEELLRTKMGNHNSYNAGDFINRIDWSRKSKYKTVFNYYRGLISLRKSHKAFRMRSALEIREKLKFLDTGRGVVGFVLGDHAGNDVWRKIVVVYNANRHFSDVKLPMDANTCWNTIVEGYRAGTTAINPVYSCLNIDTISVLPVSTMVLYSE